MAFYITMVLVVAGVAAYHFVRAAAGYHEGQPRRSRPSLPIPFGITQLWRRAPR
jgi:hypothetical protein